MNTNKLIIYFSILLLSLWHLSFQWPLKEGRITSTFCESRADHYHDGVDMVSQSDKIYPVEAGKLIYYWDKSIFPLDIYPGGGNFKVLKHANNIFSIYMHLADGTQAKSVYTINDLLGKVGNTGHSYATHLHLAILDSAKRTSQNPLASLSAYQDSKDPLILNILIRINDSYSRIRDNANIRLTKHYPLLIEITDSAQAREKMGIYKLEATMNSKKILNITFDNLGYSATGLQVNKYTFEDIFDERGYYKIKDITYSAGENTIVISATDFAGNKSEKTYSFNVKLDIK